MDKTFSLDDLSNLKHGPVIADFSKEELFHMIYHDTITGYYNWTYMWLHLDKSFRKEGLEYSFVHFNIKDMKMVNVMYGHDAANDLLISICNQMEEERKEGWVLTACRCDNDNFSMMIKVMPEEEIIERMTNFFNKVSSLPCNPNHRIFYRCGIVTAADALDKDNRVADYAKFAQNLGRSYNKNDINFFTNEMYDELIRGKKLLAELDEAIANDEFLVYFQPKFDIHTEKITGAEALVRWNYKHEKMVSPAEFIPIFEENGVIAKVDQIVLRKSCATLAKIMQMGLPMHPVSINLSRIRIKNPSLKDDLCSVIDEYKIPHKYIEFELTESSAYKDDGTMIRLLNDLHSLGFNVSLDDFGTGYSSLSILRKIPMDTLKIDKSFVDAINFEKEDVIENMLLKDIISMSKHLGFICLAEGAEHKEQVDFLRESGCDKIQGYYYSKPVPADEFIEMLKQGK